MAEFEPTGAHPVDRTNALPLWAQVHADLLRRVGTGEFATAFPGELALIDEYAVSRHTVREALRRLRDDGVVVAERGRQPRLAGTAEIEQPLGALYSLFAAVEAAGQDQHSIVRRLDVRADGVVAVRLGLEESTLLIYLERLRLADGEPLAIDRVWLPAQLAAPLLDADFTHTALYTELAERCGIRLTGGRENIRAVIPTRVERTQLDIDDTVAAFAVERLSERHGRKIEWRTTLVRGDRFSVTAAFTARTGYRLDVTGPTPHQRRLPRAAALVAVHEPDEGTSA